MTNLECSECKRQYQGAKYVCEYCLAPLDVIYPPSRDANEIKRLITSRKDIWRYQDFLPVRSRDDDPLPLVGTPLLKAERLADAIGLDGKLWIKNETSLPTHSFKDRVTAVAVAAALELGFETIACASTGNLASAVAARAAAEGLAAKVFIPQNLEREKIIAASAYGAEIVTIDGDYDLVNRHCQQLADENQMAFVNINLRPFYAEGSKTIIYEIIEQLGWTLPDAVVCPIASGSLFTKLAKGVDEWQQSGLVRGRAPAFYGAQAAGCDPVATAFSQQADYCLPQRPRTIAKSLAIGTPADGDNALNLARDSSGAIESVSEQEIVEGIRLLAETTGVFTETAGGVTIGVLKKLAKSRCLDGKEVVAVITGDGLKTIGAVAAAL